MKARFGFAVYVFYLDRKVAGVVEPKPEGRLPAWRSRRKAIVT